MIFKDVRLPDAWEEKARRNRRTTTVVTLLVCTAVLVLMGVVGMKSLQGPFGPEKATSTCPEEDVVRTTKVTREEITVSVYNAGGEKGLASKTLDRIEQAGFRPGEFGNAPDGRTIDTAVIYTTREQDSRARLLSLFMGGTPVRVVEDDFGPGLDVFMGKQPNKFNAKAPRELELPEPIVTCDRS